MAITWVGSTTSEGGAGTPTAFTPTLHTNLTGDLVLMLVGTTQGSAHTHDSPAGWEHITITNTAGSPQRLSLYSKITTGDAETAPEITVGTDTEWHASCATVREISSAMSEDTDTVAQNVAAIDMTAGAVTNVTADAIVIYAYAFDDNVSTDADVDTDAGFTGTKFGFHADQLLGNGMAMCGAYNIVSTAEAQPTCVFSTLASSEEGVALTASFAIGAAAGGSSAAVDADPFFFKL